MDWSLAVEVATLLVAALGVTWGLIELRQGSRQRKLDLGSLYLQRYWAIDDELLVLDKGTPQHDRARHRYLRLCEDEFDAARGGWFDRQQWELWHSWLCSPDSQQKLQADLTTTDPNNERFEYLRSCIHSGPAHPWSSCGAHPTA